MKVTVCFDNVRVIVPCGDGSLLIRDLIDKAVIRYKKATAKSPNQWVHVHFLKVSTDDGILDPDDQLIDVADDREQIIADFEEQGRGSLPHNGGDGTSASSTGTASPEMYHHKDYSGYAPQGKSHKLYEVDYKRPIGAEVVVTKKDLALASPLKVRRGSEPSLVLVGNSDTDDQNQQNQQDHREHLPRHASSSLPRKPHKHWTTLTVVTDNSGDPSNRINHRNRPQKRKKRRRSIPQDAVYSDDDEQDLHHGNDGFSHSNQGSFSRDSARKSLGTGNMANMYKWLDAQEKTELRAQQAEDRQEPLGGSGLPGYHSSDTTSCDTPRDKRLLVSLANEPGPLGIHVVPNFDEEGNNTSLFVQGVEPYGRIARDGRLRVGDSIVEINGTSLMNVDFNSAQEVFKDALMTDAINLVIIRPDSDSAHSDLNQSQELPSTPVIAPSSIALPLGTPTKVAPPTLPKPQRPDRTSVMPSPIRPAELNLDQKKKDSDPPMLERGQFNSSTNTKRIGHKININLVKGAEGLGFSITTRDTPAGGSCPIYIKNILSKGAAIKDGRLKSGDRLLEVNGVDLTYKTQADAVSMLRNARQGEVVELLVSRQGNPEQFQVPRPMPMKSASPETTEDEAAPRTRETVSLDIPLNETGSAGLGVSVKGKTITHGNVSNDLGIFVKSVIHGGAAQKDGRLKVNDQLVEVNSVSLLGKTNAESMQTLRKAMVTDGPVPGYINLVISRKIGAPTPTPDGGTFSFHTLGYDNKDSSDSMRSDSLMSLNDLNRTNDSIGKRSLDESIANERRAMELANQRPGSNDRYGTVPKVTSRLNSVESKAKPRPHSSIGFSTLSSPVSPTNGLHSLSLENNESPAEGDSSIPFSREAPGRQSMSEKRKGHVDPKQLDFYQKLKGDKKQDVDSQRQPPDHLPVDPHEVGPMLGLKKSSSLESLQAAVREMESQILSGEDDGGFWQQTRGRTCNESFRAAVDRSYENQMEARTMEMLEEEDGASSRGQFSVPGSSRSSFNSNRPPSVNDHGFQVNHTHNVNVNLNKPNKEPKSANKKNIFKGLFKFGQKRKSIEPPRLPVTDQKSRLEQEQELVRARCEFEAYREKKANEGVKKKTPDNYDKIKHHNNNHQTTVDHQLESQQQIRQQQERGHSNEPSNERPLPNNGDPSLFSNAPVQHSNDEMSRADRIQQLRMEHQKRHQARQGKYPLDEQEEWAEREIRRMEIKNFGRYGNTSQDYSSLPDWLDRPEVLYAQPHNDRSFNNLRSDTNLIRNRNQQNPEVRGHLGNKNFSHGRDLNSHIMGGNLSHMSPRGPYVHTHRSVFDSPSDSPRLRAGSFDHPRSRSETRETSGAQTRVRSKTPNFSSSNFAKENHNRFSLATENLLIDPMDYEDPRRVYRVEPQYAVVNRRPHKV